MAEFLPIPVEWATQSETHATYNPDRHVDQCFICGRGLTEAAIERGWFIHMTTDNTLAPIDLPEGVLPEREDQGFFPIGTECAKQIPRTHKTKNA